MRADLVVVAAPFCHGFLGSISAVSMPASCSHRRIAHATNSGSVVRPQIARRAVHAHELRQDLKDAAGPNAASHITSRRPLTFDL